MVLGNFAYCIIMFPSVGDAASFEKYCRKNAIKLSDNIVCTGLNVNYLFPASKDNSGKPFHRHFIASGECLNAVTENALKSIEAPNNFDDLTLIL